MSRFGIVAKTPKLYLLLSFLLTAWMLSDKAWSNVPIASHPSATPTHKLQKYSRKSLLTDPVIVERVSVSTSTACSGDTIRLIAEVTGPSIGGLWTVDTPTRASFLDQTAESTSLIVTGGGPVVITYTTLDPDGSGPCLPDSASADIQVVNIIYSADIMDIDCFDDNGRAIFSLPIASYTISLLTPGLIVGDTIITASSGRQVFQISDGTCSIIDSLDIFDLRFDETLPPETLSGEVGETLSIPAPPSTENSSLLWIENGEITIDENIYMTEVSADGSTVDLTVMTGSCSRRYQYIVEPILPESNGLKRYLANIIHPNGVNDTWNLPLGSPYDIIIDVGISDRWGNLIYHGSDILVNEWQGWDGSRSGRAVSAGVYTYYIQAVHNNGAIDIAVGDLTVIH